MSKPNIKDTAQLRGFLVEQMVKVSEGQQEPNHAKAICNYAQQIYNTVNMEIRYGAAKSKLGNKAMQPVVFNRAGR